MTSGDQGFLMGLRGLRSFTQGCDLEALALAHPDPLELMEALIADDQVKKEELGRYWGSLVNAAYVDPLLTVVSDEAVALLPAEIAAKSTTLPLYILGETLTVVMAHPEDKALLERLSKIIKMPVSAGFGFASDITDMIRVHYSSELTVEESLRDAEAHAAFKLGSDLSSGSRALAELAQAEQVVHFIDGLVFFALRQRASDIHIEPRDGEGRVRYRVDGTLRVVLAYPRKIHASIITSLKVRAQLNIAETRFPADGRFSMAFGTTKIDFRFSCMPTQYGEKAVLRILGNTSQKSQLTLDRMMVSQSILVPYRRLMQNPAGIFFVTGPTGSGKTTTLYATLAELNDVGVNIATIEDPIELRMAGISQSQVEAGIKLQFADLLRSLLRQDPDVLLIGEIRDLETAKIATEAALTGHLVLATLHTNNAPDAVIRLMEIGIDPYMIAPSVIGVLGQRLAARICDNCKQPYHPSEDVLRRYFNDDEMPEVTFYRGKGCHVCNGTGFKGRVAFHELMVVNREIRSLIVERANPNEILKAAQRIGYRPLRYDGLKKVLLGLTTIEEIETQTPVEFEG